MSHKVIPAIVLLPYIAVVAKLPRVKSLEGQISELESEASRLLRALDTAKEAKAEVERTERKRAEELSREVTTQVS